MFFEGKHNNKEQRLLSMFRQGNSRAMDALYAEYADYLAGACARYVPSPDDRRDVLQEALIKIFTGIGRFQYRGAGSLRGWMTRVVVNEALLFLRQQRKMAFADGDENLLPDFPDEPPDTEGLTADDLQELMARLPDGYRAVFNLYAIEGRSHKEIAQMLGIKPDTSASQYHRARAMLARMIKQKQRNET